MSALRACLFALALFLVVGPISPDHARSAEKLGRKVESLTHLMETIAQVKGEVVLSQKALSGRESLGKEAAYRERIERLSKRLHTLETGFQQLATGIENLPDPQSDNKNAFEWNQELKELLGPLISEVKRLTARPREIQNLRDQLEGFDQELAMVSRALKNLQELKNHPGVPLPLSTALSKLENKWKQREQELSSLKGFTEIQLQEKEEGRPTIGGSLQRFARLFFKSRGRNFLMALAVLFGTLFAMGRIRALIETRSRLYDRAQTMYARIFDLTYMIITAFVTLAATMGSLYLVSDWVLLSILFIFVIGLLWASKEAVPKLWSQIRMLLNLGAVREGERLVYKGIPYRVRAMGIYTELENPALDGGRVRLPLRDFSNLRSRPSHDDEPWFPTQTGDWVLLHQTTLAQVQNQTPEFVALKEPGGAIHTIPSPLFIEEPPRNLSQGFRIETTFRTAQTLPSKAIPLLPQRLSESLTERLAEEDQRPAHLEVGLSRVFASSLQFTILADFKGKLASQHPQLTLAIQRLALEIALEQEWPLPAHRIALTDKEKNTLQ